MIPAAPLAAGLIADAMATNQIPATRGIPAVDAIMKYAQGWPRLGGERVVWNHVDKAHNPPSDVLIQSLSNKTLAATAAVA